MLKIGTRVKGAHGVGTVVAYNEREPNQYLLEKPQEALDIAQKMGTVVLLDGTRVDALKALVGSFYSADRYPYIVKFDTGYQDVYSDGELVVV